MTAPFLYGRGRPHGPLLRSRPLRQSHQAIHMPLRVCHNQSSSSKSRRQPVCKIIHPLLMTSSSSQRHSIYILSDNHKTFISGEKFLLDLQEDDNIREFLQDHRISWRHQTPRSPWMGGHFERLVRTIKASLSAAIARKLWRWNAWKVFHVPYWRGICIPSG